MKKQTHYIQDKASELYFARVTPDKDPVPLVSQVDAADLFTLEHCSEIAKRYYSTANIGHFVTVGEATASHYMKFLGHQNAGKKLTGKKLTAAQRNGRKGGRPRKKVAA